MTTHEVLSVLRDARFAYGVACPRCAQRECPRWGRFKGRQRYLCRRCDRTFSDLTGTPAAYSKYLDRWWTYAFAMQAAVPIRTAAQRVGVHPSTAFRWRHRSLAGLLAQDTEKLTGWIEIASQWFAYSEKGSRRLGRDPRHHGLRDPWPAANLGVNVLIAADRLGHAISCLLGPAQVRRLQIRDLERGLAGRLAQPAILSMPEGSFGPGARLATTTGAGYVDARGPRDRRRASLLMHMHTVTAYRIRMLKWLRRFRGVATKYLHHYLVWHRVVDAGIRHGTAAQVLRWALPSGFG